MPDRIVSVVADGSTYQYTRPDGSVGSITSGRRADGSLGTFAEVEVDISPTDQRLSGSKWHECALCSWVDRESAMSLVGGRYYCNKNGCADEKSAGSAR